MKKMPLFIVTGASGVGKTTVMHELRSILPEFDVFSTDNDNFGTTASKLEYQDRFNLLFHFANAVAKSGRGTIICGTLMPWAAEKCDTYSSFSEVCFINLHCDDETRNTRLRNRADHATWTDEMLKQHEEFAQWLIHNAATAYNPPMPTMDTTSTPPAQVAEQIKQYVMSKWDERNGEIKYEANLERL
ncbi:AAA family ATPase [Paenibacillus sp. NPDC056579]|uniref:AAA family ATPase n=1 Tax=unclassified Paenibacillus TaxID=185978 RepID=UPI001EF94970|nr:AAA family ATPase [Paenibacillus sp. H1-7]ULL16956.1 nucleoside kinase [Paenibacillus sp. H1-7]